MTFLPHVHSVSYHSPWDEPNVERLEFVRSRDDDPEHLLTAALHEELGDNSPADLGIEEPVTDVKIDGVAVEINVMKAMGYDT